MAKRPKPGVNLDQISKLPDKIVCRIISFLPFKQAVRTSILSTRWRYLYASMSTFDLDFDDWDRPDLDFDDRHRRIPMRQPNYWARHFAHFVDRLMYLPRAKATLDCFRINLNTYNVDALHVYGWIYAALGCRVKELDLQLRHMNFPELPTTLYTSSSLVTLKLNMSQHVVVLNLTMSQDVLKVPTNVCLPNLKTLHLRYIAFSDANSIQRLLENCIVLEELVIKECDNYNVNHVGLNIFKSLVTLKLKLKNPGSLLEVPTNYFFPNLKTLHLRGILFSDNDSARRLISSCIVLEDLVIKYCELHITELHISSPSLKRLKFFTAFKPLHYSVVINAPNLVYFKYVDFISKHGYPLRDSLYSGASVYECKCAANQLLQAIGNVKSLHLTLPQPNQVLDQCYGEPKLVFPNLVVLEIVEGENNHSNCWQGTWLVEFLQCAPNITSLLISLESERAGDWSPPDKVPDCLSKLKEIKMLKFNEENRLFNMITYFLMNAKGLEKLTLCMNGLKEGGQLSIAKKLLKLPRRSSDKCQVLFE